MKRIMGIKNDKKIHSSPEREKHLLLTLIFGFIFYFQFFYIYLFIFIILKIIYFIKNKNIMIFFINYLLKNILIIIIIIYIKV